MIHRAGQKMEGEKVLMRIHIGERDEYRGKPLHVAILELLRERHFAGATVLPAAAGFGAHATLHAPGFLRRSHDRPLVIECVDSEERIEAILSELDPMIGSGIITLERAHVLIYRAGALPDEPA